MLTIASCSLNLNYSLRRQGPGSPALCAQALIYVKSKLLERVILKVLIMSYVKVTFQQGGIDDLQEFFAALDGRCALHERRRRRRVRVIQLFHKVAPFL